MIHNVSLRSVIAVAFACALLFLSARPSFAQEADAPVLYFADRNKPGQNVAIGDEPIKVNRGPQVNLRLELRLPAPGDQEKFVPLIIDDYRRDRPEIIRAKRVPNVVFEITTEDGKPVPFGASSHGGGYKTEVMNAEVNLYIGIDPEPIYREMRQTALDMRDKPPIPGDAEATSEEKAILGQKLVELQKKLQTSHPGIYHVRAHYRPKVAGKWIGEVSAKPITVKIVATK